MPLCVQGRSSTGVEEGFGDDGNRERDADRLQRRWNVDRLQNDRRGVRALQEPQHYPWPAADNENGLRSKVESAQLKRRPVTASELSQAGNGRSHPDEREDNDRDCVVRRCAGCPGNAQGEKDDDKYVSGKNIAPTTLLDTCPRHTSRRSKQRTRLQIRPLNELEGISSGWRLGGDL